MKVEELKPGDEIVRAEGTYIVRTVDNRHNPVTVDARLKGIATSGMLIMLPLGSEISGTVNPVDYRVVAELRKESLIHLRLAYTSLREGNSSLAATYWSSGLALSERANEEAEGGTQT